MDWFNNKESKNKKNKDSKNSNIMNDNNTKKKKNRFLSCFRPDSMEGFLFPKLLSPPLTLVKNEEQEKVGGGGKKKHRNPRLSRILKAIFTGTFLAKKVRKRKSIQNSFTPETNVIATKTTVNKTDSMKQEDIKLGNNSSLNSTPSPKQWQDKHANIVEENEEERCGSLSKQIVQDKDNNIVEENTNGEGRYATGFFLIRWSSRYLLPKHRLKLKSGLV
ncbi:hypothetical protein ACB098_06G053300 [Castanea mollissima]